MTPSRRRGILLGTLGVGAVALALFVGSRGSSTTTAKTAPPPSAETEIPKAPVPTQAPLPTASMPKPAIAPGGPTMDDVVAAQKDPTTNDVLIAGLASDDKVIAAESANALVGRGALSAIPTLLELDVIARPWAAPSLIYAMGKLAAVSSDEDRDAVIDRLLELLAIEKKRGAQESGANLLQIYEALGDTGDARAIAPLEKELVDASVPTAPKVVIVQALVTLGARESKPALERLRDQLEPTAKGDDLEAAVRRDLLTAIREALVQLS